MIQIQIRSRGGLTQHEEVRPTDRFTRYADRRRSRNGEGHDGPDRRQPASRPEETSVRPGDTVTWKNIDTAVAPGRLGHRCVPVARLKPGESYSFHFSTASSYSYHDEMRSDMTGVVHVQSPPVTVGVTSIRAVYGSPVRVFGSIPNGASGQQVTIHISAVRWARRRHAHRVHGQRGHVRALVQARHGFSTEFSAEWNGDEEREALR